ncbi:MAG: hypothetical protein ACLQJ0_25900 [Steroidobacteraceae bacterium]|jgi:hypothetical protein
MSLIDVELNCEASNLITQTKENPGNASQGQGVCIAYSVETAWGF